MAATHSGTDSTTRQGNGRSQGGVDVVDADSERFRDRLIAEAAASDEDLSELIRLYYRYVPVEEFAGDDPADLVGAVRSSRALAEHRAPGRPVVRILNPTRAEDGWRSATTVVQVVTDDMPYLVDSVAAELSRADASVQRIVHPIVVVRRDVAGNLVEVLADVDPDEVPEGATAESWMHLEVDLITDHERAREVENRLVAVLGDVREVVEDSARMKQKALELAEELDTDPPRLESEEVADGANFLRWLIERHFVFLGYRRYELVTEDEGEPGQRAMLSTGLGVLRADSLSSRKLLSGPDTALAPELLVLTQASARASVRRNVFPYYVGLKTFDENGEVDGEHRFLGLLTGNALHEDVLDIPVIERKVRNIIRRAGFPLNSYSGQRMLDTMQTYPRSELMSTSEDELYGIVTGVLALADRRMLRLFLRRDPYRRFYSCLVYLPRDRYTTRGRRTIQEVLESELGGEQLEYGVSIGESELARVHYMINTDPSAEHPEVDVAALQQKLIDATRTWDDLMTDAVLAEQSGEGNGVELTNGTLTEQVTRLANSFPAAYKEDFGAEIGLNDLHRLNNLSTKDFSHTLEMSFYVPLDADAGQRRFKIYHVGERITLTQVLPVLQRMGVEVVDERPYQVFREDGVGCWIYDFGLHVPPGVLDRLEEDVAAVRGRFERAFEAAWTGNAEVDGLNSLVLRAGVDWEQAAVLRAYVKYLRQAGIQYSQDYIESAILRNTRIATLLIQLFEARFDPNRSERERESTAEDLTTEVLALIDEVTSLDEDRILRSLHNLVTATLRTSYNVCDENGDPRGYLAVKLDPRRIPELPEPRPRFEIFVYSPRFEGVHLRFGPVARGGLRWSDRREDFRTEILGLAKAQQVKNAVIVPLGAKGGFVLKRAPAPTGDPGIDRENTQREGVTCYRMFVSAMLDLTDNLRTVDGVREVVPAKDVVRYDGDDSYLVVAADKGTATFSDIANEVSKSYGFWLGDAFASGGSVGYDHKGMGITAKGAWESVKRHFRELGVDTQRESFTVVGVGDMSGDVFGNGMLCSEHIRLVAAFDHRHIFIDPEPDAATGYAERRRMFELPRSSWADYDRSLISEGGGIWPRTAKSIPVSPQAAAALGLEPGELSPAELMTAILRAPVDLLWNGGIGTYVKASTETQADAGDKANDAIRVDGGELRVKVVGEGGNLGCTQRGRIEFARAGGKINTDALDNSAGVSCSDHEVNIKVLLDQLVADGTLDPAARDELLLEMTDEVGELVLGENYAQNELLGVSRSHAANMLTVHARLVNDLVRNHGLDREIEALPSKAEFRKLDKEGKGLTSPELATLVAHVKLTLKQQVLDSDLPDAEVFAARLPEYFPSKLRERFGDSIFRHSLHREITTTALVNELVNGAGVSFAFRLAEEISATTTDSVRAYTAVTRIFRLPELWRKIEALDNVVSSAVQDELILETRRLLDRACRWLLSNRPQPIAVGAEISRFAEPVGALLPRAMELLRGGERELAEGRARRWTEAGVPAEFASAIGGLLNCYGLLDVIEVSELAEQDAGFAAERPVEETTELYFALSEHLSADEMLTSVSELDRGDRWHALARLALRDDLYGSLRSITLDVLRQSDPGDAAAVKIDKWERSNSSRLARARGALTEIAESGSHDLATLSVAARQVRNMVR
ncbi:NAD-glutamate dehydrogenase [Sciscionella marina]|uniref:NAD-glutamate dehydrogenase n=1 Tax=Sciscionella marina TaxID=508770 RepID=UPI000A046994|nr:NAD-glutamate dehydrogenase [Sciscionella marina]